MAQTNDAAQANAANAAADEAAVKQAEASGEGNLAVLTSAFVARTDSKNQTTRRYRRGDVFNVVKDVHDVEALIKAKVLGRVGGDKALKPSTALDVAQAQAEIHQEASPVIDLQSQPFEQAPAKDDTEDDE